RKAPGFVIGVAPKSSSATTGAINARTRTGPIRSSTDGGCGPTAGGVAPGSVSPVEPGDCLTPGHLSVDVSDAQRNSAQRTRPALACQRRRVTVRGIRSWRRFAAAPGRHRGGVGEPVVRAERDTPPVAAASGTALVDARAFCAAG